MQIIDLNKLPAEAISHDAGSSKQVYLRNGSIPHLTQLAQARIPAGSRLTEHAHSDMHEIFVVLSGTGEVHCQEQTLSLLPGACVHIEPHESHAFSNTGKDDLVLLYCGLLG